MILTTLWTKCLDTTSYLCTGWAGPADSNRRMATTRDTQYRAATDPVFCERRTMAQKLFGGDHTWGEVVAWFAQLANEMTQHGWEASLAVSRSLL